MVFSASVQARLRTLASEILGAICLLSLNEGHKAVLGAFSDYRAAFNESFRFERFDGLIGSLRLPDLDSDIESDDRYEYIGEQDGVWEARCASMALINALTNSPESLEDRIILRDDFSRRGLNEVVLFRPSHSLWFEVFLTPWYQVLRHDQPPDVLMPQLYIYSEEKFEDEQDMRDRAPKAVDISARPLIEKLRWRTSFVSQSYTERLIQR
ncbi:armadillo-type protein [Mycena alexandri]|uniref:Armadillo-type protein n=1 Tax=Mycena alexandri TaxID=1745969 RepID=A0AAD6WW54_9AGAR|nr:armadillo-type protein [Mycena alexandri]